MRDKSISCWRVNRNAESYRQDNSKKENYLESFFALKYPNGCLINPMGPVRQRASKCDVFEQEIPESSFQIATLLQTPSPNPSSFT